MRPPNPVLAALPAWFWEVPYSEASYPGGVARSELRTGANCQLFAYEVLAVHGFSVPDFRSDDLWLDESATVHVAEPQPLDLVLFQKDTDPYGAHVGVVVGPDEVLHLCKEVGHAVVWAGADFLERPRYQVRLGYKRPTRRTNAEL